MIRRNEDHIMRNPKKWIAIAFFAPFAIALFVWLGGEIVMRLWNWLTPELFGWRQITFWQALGLLTLCRILFGGLSGHGGPRSSRRMREGWGKMTPEEREKCRQAFQDRWRSAPPPPDATPTA
jgi:hypothetical protein